MEIKACKGVDITEQELTDEHLPFYPIKPDGKTSDLGVYHTAQEDTDTPIEDTRYDMFSLGKMGYEHITSGFGDAFSDMGGIFNWKLHRQINYQPSKAKPVYPFNKTNMTETDLLAYACVIDRIL